MSAAILQGVPATTLDTDLWIDLPRRQYIHVLNLCRRLGATVRANTVVDLADVPGVGDDWRRRVSLSVSTQVQAVEAPCLQAMNDCRP